MLSYHDKLFVPVSNTSGGEVSRDTVFHYRQEGRAIWGTYTGGDIVMGTLVGKVFENDCLDFRYQHLGRDGQFRSGKCRSTPEVLPDGRIRLHEEWQWTSGDQSTGKSVLEEVE